MYNKYLMHTLITRFVKSKKALKDISGDNNRKHNKHFNFDCKDKLNLRFRLYYNHSNIHQITGTKY